MQSHFISAVSNGSAPLSPLSAAKQTSKSLCLFFHGWGGDVAMLSSLPCDESMDILVLFDYRDLTIDAATLARIQSYQTIHVVAWSFGVWVGAFICQREPINAQTAVAYNGTLYPIHEQFGIPETVARGTLTGLNDKTRQKFYQRMCSGRAAFQQLQQSQSERRSIADVSEELAALYGFFEQFGTPKNCYQRAVIGEQDRIFSCAAQTAAWQSIGVAANLIPAAHFCFDEIDIWQQLV